MNMAWLIMLYIVFVLLVKEAVSIEVNCLNQSSIKFALIMYDRLEK